MLEQKDLQAIEILLDQKFERNNKILKDDIISETKILISKNNKILKDDIISEIAEITSEAFSNVEARIDHLEDKFDSLEIKVDKISDAVAQCPTREEVFNWADRRLIDLEIAKDRHDYLHINELANLPLPIEISKTLIKRGFKRKMS